MSVSKRGIARAKPVVGACAVVLSLGAAATGLLPIATADATPPSNCTGTTTVTCTFSYNGTDGSDGSAQSFTVPDGVSSVTIEAWAAQGGGNAGGLGGHERGTISVTASALPEATEEPHFDMSSLRV